MKTVTVELGAEIANRVLADLERVISERIQARDELAVEITTLEEQTKSLRTQLQGINGAKTRSDFGDNRTRIKEYLSKLPNNKGARMTEIHIATGIGKSSVAFTLKNYKTDFTQDDEKVWKVKAQ